MNINIEQQIESYLQRFDAMSLEQKKRQFDLALSMLPNALHLRRGRPVHTAHEARPQRIECVNELV